MLVLNSSYFGVFKTLYLQIFLIRIFLIEIMGIVQFPKNASWKFFIYMIIFSSVSNIQIFNILLKKAIINYIITNLNFDFLLYSIQMTQS